MLIRNQDKLPELLCIGHMCHDRIDGGYRLGGTASYSSLMSAHVGMSTALLTSVGNDFKYWDTIREHDIVSHNVAAKETTEFENVYTDTGRTQYMHQRANSISSADIPAEWLHVPAVLFCLIADEVDSMVVVAFPDSFVAASIQGWMRGRDDISGKISPKELNMNRLQGVDMVFLSKEDIGGDLEMLKSICSAVDTVIMTNGAHPVQIYRGKSLIEMPVFPTQEVDPTGAGDIFSASFVIQYRRTGSILLAGAYAHSAASHVVEHEGVYLPSLEDIESRYTAYIEQFLS
jgi:sugar/nucleoside kinase (ribokinase family)